MMAMMSLQDVGPIIEANGFVTVSNPPAEPEAWVLATAEALQKEGFDPSMHMLVEAADLCPLLSNDMRAV
jgi:hypothetical protein